MGAIARDRRARRAWRGAAVGLLASLALAAHRPVDAATYVATNAAELQTLSDGLVAGDLLLVEPGNYTLSTWRIRNLAGRRDAWIEIRAGDAGPVRITGNANQNVVNVDNVSFVRISGFEITYSGGNSDIDGLKFNAGTNSDHVILDRLWVHDITGVALNSKAGELSHLDVSGCHLHDTGGTGEGMYLGCNGAACWIRDSVIRQNLVHDMHGSQGDGIEIKPGSFRNVVEDNVVFRTNGWVGITLYRTQRGNFADNNLVRRNASWDSGECFFAAAETTLVDNLAFGCDYGINTNDHSGLGVSDLVIAHNTVFDCPAAGIRLGSWSIGTGLMAAANNASYQPGGGAPALRAPSGLGSALVEANVHFGGNEWGGGSSVGQPPATDLENPAGAPGAIDLGPAAGSTLLDAGRASGSVTTRDFELKARSDGAPDVGAYEGAGGVAWPLAEDFKPLPEDAGPVAVSDGTGAGAPLRVTRSAPDALRLTWDADGCRSWNYHLLSGPLAQVATLGADERSCYLGNRGVHDSALVQDGVSRWYLIVGGGDSQQAGPLGRDSFGAWRPVDPALGSCGLEVEEPPRDCN